MGLAPIRRALTWASPFRYFFSSFEFSGVSGSVGPRAPHNTPPTKFWGWICHPQGVCEGYVRMRSSATRDRNLQLWGAASTGFLNFLQWTFFSSFWGFLCNSERKWPQNVEKIARFPGGENSVESCHVSGCHGYIRSEYGLTGCVQTNGTGNAQTRLLGAKTRILHQKNLWRQWIMQEKGVFHAKGWWPKTSCCPAKVCLPWVSKRGIWDVPGTLPGCPGPLEFFKKLVLKKFVRIFRSLIKEPWNTALVAPYRAIPRDYLSDTPLACALWGFWCLNMANWVRYPLPLFWTFPPWRACEVEVRYPPPPQKGYLSDTCAIPYENKGIGCDTPLCDTISKRYCAIWGWHLALDVEDRCCLQWGRSDLVELAESPLNRAFGDIFFVDSETARRQ